MADEWGALEHYLRDKTRPDPDIARDFVVAPVVVLPVPALSAPVADVPA